MEDTIVEKLGYDSEKVTVVIARDGIFLADREKADGVYITSNGTMSTKAKVVDDSGKTVQIPEEFKTILFDAEKVRSTQATQSAKSLSNAYEGYEYIEDYEVKETGIDEVEPEL